MLQPPGSSSNRSKPYAANRRKTQESPDDLVRQLQRNPPNKKCADCNARLPQCVNLTMGTFVCISCAGIHRELNNRVKGIGHSSFTQEEVDRLKATDNDQINALWMAKYNPSDRMKPPQGNQDQQHIRAWIRRKYQDKAWYASSPADTKGQPPPQRSGPPQATIVAVPPPTQDLLGSLGGSAPAPSKSSESWDAFGQSNQATSDPFAQAPPTQQSFANFGPPPNQPNDPFAAPPQQNFASFGQSPPRQPQQQQQQQQDPFATSQQQNFANFPSQSPPPKPQQNQDPFAAPQPQNFANFAQTQPPQPQQQQQQQDPFATPQQQNFANFGGPTQQQQFANFNQQPNSAPQQFGNFGNMTHPQGQGPQMMPQPPSAQQMPQMGNMQPPQPQQGFASFNQMPGQQQQPFASQQPQQMGGMQPQQQGFAAFDQMQAQQQQPPPQQPSAQPATSQQPPQMGGMQPQQQGFAAFDQMQAQQQQQQPPPLVPSQQLPQMGAMSTQQQGVGSSNQMPAQQQQTTGPSLTVNQQAQPTGNMQPQQQAFTAFNQMQSQQQPMPAMASNQQPPPLGGMPAPQQGFAAFNQMNTPQQGQIQGDGNTTMNSAPSTTAPPQHTESLGNAAPKENPMDAFAHLSVDKSPVPSLNTTTPPVSMKPGAQKEEQSSRYVADQVVCYRRNGDRCKAKVVKVHLDDALEPFYTIKLEFGKEKQTDDAHLEELNPLFEKLESVLLSLSGEQLAQVETFISQLPNRKTLEGKTTDVQSTGSNGSSSAPSTGGMPISNQTESNAGNGMAPQIPQLHSIPTQQQQQVQAQGQGAPQLQMRMQQPPSQAQGMPQQQFNAQMSHQQPQYHQMNIAPQQGMMSGQPQQQLGMVQPNPYGQNPAMMMMQQQTNAQPMGMQQPNPMTHQIPANGMGQAPQVQPPMSPQGNPFDMY